MKQLFTTIVLLSILTVTSFSKAETTVLEGVFQGLDLYVNNPMLDEGEGIDYCIKSIEINIRNVKAHNFSKGILANFFSPHPYLFWLLVGAPFTIKAYNENLISAILFIMGFYIFIIGTKLFVAFITQKSKRFISTNKYLIIVKLLGFVLLIFSLILIKDGLQFIGIWG